MRKLIIVCDEKCRPYADYFLQLLGLEDDSNDEVIGIKDGSVSATIWLEKDYNANSVQLASNQHLLFIGNSKFIKQKSKHMNIKFNEFGISYGWIGKQAFILVESNVK